MAIHKLEFDEFDEKEYHLIAIHTSLEDYRLAYLINQKLLINLSKKKDEIQIKTKEGESEFSIFHYYDTKKEITWNLVQNKKKIIREEQERNLTLFLNKTLEVATKVYLLPEFKKVDYFLKVENEGSETDATKIQLLLNTINSISTAYKVETNKTKSKNNLIF